MTKNYRTSQHAPTPLTIQKSLPFEREGSILTLIDMGYTRVPIVMEPGEFSVKGDVIDVFSPHHTNPIRIDSFGKTIERLTSFNVITQRSMSELSDTTLFPYSPNDTPSIISEHVHEDLQLVSAFTPGDYVVHEDYGIGIYQGLIRLTLSQLEGEYAFIQYKGADKVYLPLNQFKRLTKYVGPGSPRLNGLYDGSWKVTQATVQRAAELLVEELFELYKKRALEVGFACQDDSEAQLEIESAFPYPLTRDQETALNDIKADMEASHPMDRLLCGEVGFGKTEVFLRAAFKMVDNGHQVAVICPTTILVEQHEQTFQKRLSQTGLIIKSLSRFQTPAKRKKIIKDLSENKLDILIGTHALLNSSIKFAKLGLVIIDEEQRFGVDHKEQFKKSYPHVDILTVSATPIPRTLYMSLTGARALSQIQSPPKKRQPIYTFIEERSNTRIKAVLHAEKARNGQSFFIHNKVATIYTQKAKLERLCPDLTFGVLHGQLPEDDIQTMLRAFKEKKIDVLLCTTIIENGIDFPNANTIIINKIDHFGLAQVHQLRGRVGRSETQGFAYFFYSKHDALTETAKKRLAAIRDYTAFGTGYQLALKDLEIRGAGSLLGKKQHGHITAIGFDLYCKVMDMAMKKRQGIAAPKQSLIMLDPTYKAYFPERYIPDERERIALYKRLANVEYLHDIEDLIAEIKDRYGKLPSSVRDFLTSIKVQLYR